MKDTWWRWTPFAVLAFGALLCGGARPQRATPLQAPLAASVPREIAGYGSRDVPLSDAELEATGVSSYLMRVYSAPGAAAGNLFSMYVGYYESQTRGRTIHSPKNCLPGGGWVALVSSQEEIATATGRVTVNRYLIQRGEERALVLYWYQGRGRAESSEYRVKWDLLRDSIVRGRTDEALVRIMVPVGMDEGAALRVAAAAAAEVIPALGSTLPT